MPYIYEPRGKAREYSPLALNVYSDCDHGCLYCYVPDILHRPRAVPRFRIDLDKLRREVMSADKTKRILLSFMCDPYCHADVEIKGTRKVLDSLVAEDLKVTILSKGGKRILRDLDIFERFTDITFGTTLVFTRESQEKMWEPEAAPTAERIHILRQLHNLGFQTWVSLEPVIEPQQSLDLIDLTSDIVDHFKVGKLNHDQIREAAINWTQFGTDAVKMLRSLGKSFYVKYDLRRKLPPDFLKSSESEMDGMP